MTGRILSAPRFNEGWIPAPYREWGRLFAGMTKGYAKVSLRGDRLRGNDGLKVALCPLDGPALLAIGFA